MSESRIQQYFSKVWNHQYSEIFVNNPEYETCHSTVGTPCWIIRKFEKALIKELYQIQNDVMSVCTITKLRC